MSNIVLFWVWFCAYLNCIGWALSALGELNALGYAVALLFGLCLVGLWKNASPKVPAKRFYGKKLLRRFRRPFAFCFLILLMLAFLGGVIYPPANWDALTYRIPRILHWLAVDRWHWIHTLLPRLNDRSCGIEWVSTPFICLFKTDRLLFLINILSISLLPGLAFSLFTRLGVNKRVAWYWMWIVPTGFGFILQAGSIGNDLFGAVFALASVDYALRAKASGSSVDIFTSVISAAMMTSAKIGNLPLLLPWAIAIYPSFRLALDRPLKVLFGCTAVLLVSALPTMFLNQTFSGDWSGIGLNIMDNDVNVNREFGRFSGVSTNIYYQNPIKAMAWRLSANSIQLAIENFAPPVFPWNDSWNNAIGKRLQPNVKKELAQLIEWPSCEFRLDAIQFEDNAGMGLGVSSLLLGSTIAALFRRKITISDRLTAWRHFVSWSPTISLMGVLAMSNLSTIGRLLIPYYALLLPPLLACSGHAKLVRRRWWRVAAFAVFPVAAGLLIISPIRPLVPATIFKVAERMRPDLTVVTEIENKYSYFRERPNAFSSVLPLLPPGLTVLGVTTFNDPQTSLWQPYGVRRVEEIRPNDTSADLKARGVEYILLRSEMFGKWFPCPLDEWLKRMNAQIVPTRPIIIRISVGHASSAPCNWYLAKLN